MELELLAGEFLDGNLPREKQYLVKYFSTKVQRVFVRYFLIFGNYDHFSEHTGYSCTEKWLKKLAVRFIALEDAMRAARASGDFETLAQIELGEWVISKM